MAQRSLSFGTLGFAMALVGCGTVKYGDKEAEAALKRLTPVSNKVSLYACREPAAFVGAGAKATVIVANQPIGTLRPNNFAHVVLEPGAYEIYIRRESIGTSNSGVLKVDGKAGEVAIIWVGVVAAGFGGLTLDFFPTRAEAERCVKGAEYAVRAE